MSKSGDTTTTSSSSSLPSWYEPYAKDLLTKAKDVTEEPYQAYQGQRLADFSPDTTGAFDLIRANANGGAPALDAEHQRRLAAFLSEEILSLGTPLADLRAWLGAPDDLHVWSGGARREQYLLSRPAYDTPREGGLYGDLDLEYGPDLRLRAASLKYLRWRIEPTLRASTALTPEEHARLGLPRFEKTRGPASRGP